MTDTHCPPASVQLNGQAYAWREGLTAAELLRQAGLADEGQTTRIATALNGQFLPRAQRAATPLQAGDALTTFAAIVGG
jgi:sulfur carrier protein